MKEKKVNSIELAAEEENIKEALLFFRQRLAAQAISKEILSEIMLVIEALLHNLFAQGISSDTMLHLSCRRKLGDVRIRIGYQGKMAFLYTEEDDGESPENRILRAYEDKIGSSYRFGFNSFQISVKKAHMLSLLYCIIGALCAVLVYILLRLFTVYRLQLFLVAYVFAPTEQLMVNAAVMIAAPVTFFSLLRNLTDIYILSERLSDVRKLWRRELINSFITLFLAFGLGMLFLSRIHYYDFMDPAEEASVAEMGRNLAISIEELIPPSIFEPFESVSPVPLIFVALITTYALCSSNPYFASLRRAVNICYSVFSRMLGLVLFTLPFFVFVVTLDLLYFADMRVFGPILLGMLLIFLGSAVVFVFLILQLKIGGVRLRPFLKKLPPMILENCRINSSIDAVPYNIRYCARNYGMNRKWLEKTLPFIAQIALDGNCFLLMSLSMLLLFAFGYDPTWYNVLGSAFLVFFLSLGAPNQPGSILIGTTILLQYYGIQGDDLLTLAFLPIFFEAIFGTVQNLLNVVADIVSVLLEHPGKMGG